MRTFIIVALCSLALSLSAQKINRTEVESKKHQTILIGFCNKDGFKLIHAFDSAYTMEYSLYQPEKQYVESIPFHLKKVKITIVMGSWCGDSREWVPRFYNIMDKTGFNYEKNLKIISVDRDRKAPGTKVDLLKIERVPTFIFYRRNKEIGRIIETPADIFEKEILRIISTPV
jgi:thiol-disulfide isomerase/thioredoxin